MAAAQIPSLIVNYGHLSDPKYIDKTETILDATLGSTIFGEFPTDGSPERLAEKLRILKEAHEAAKDGGKKAREARKASREETDQVIYTMGHHIQSYCGGNVEKLAKSGFDMKQQRATGSTRTVSPPAPPLSFVVEQDGQSRLRCKLDRGKRAVSCEIWATEGDPSVEADWQYKASSAEFEFTVNGFVAGTRYAIKARFVGKGGPGDWSNVITLVPE